MYTRETLEFLQESKKRRSRVRPDRVREYDRKLVKDEYNAFIIKESTDMELMIALDESGYDDRFPFDSGNRRIQTPVAAPR